MALKKQSKNHDVVIAAANKLYDESIKMFVEAELKIDDANLQLDATIEEIDNKISGLQGLREQAIANKERNSSFKTKLGEFTTQ